MGACRGVPRSTMQASLCSIASLLLPCLKPQPPVAPSPASALQEKLRAQRAAGLLQDFPPPPAEKPRPSKGLKRRLKSVPVAGPAPQPQQQKQQPVVQPVQARPAAVPVSLEARHEEL